MTTQLDGNERRILALVLEPRPQLTAKSGPSLKALSLYSSELKSLKQIAAHLESIHAGTGIHGDTQRTKDRYFRSLQINGLVEGDVDSPALTEAGEVFRQAVAGADTSQDGYWQTGGLALELPSIKAQATLMKQGEDVSDAFRRAWFNAQEFFDRVPPAELADVLGSPETLLFLFRINSLGWEIARYFRLDPPERDAFKEAHAKTLKPDFAPTKDPVDQVAALYAKAAGQYQADVRFRISAFLNSFNQLREELGAEFPRLDAALKLNAGVAASAQDLASQTSGAQPAALLGDPHQLIVSGCPGSGKSYYLTGRVEHSGAEVFRTQFHPETSYFDFVGAYKPQPLYEAVTGANIQTADGTAFSRGRPLIDYQFTPGPLVQALTHALAKPGVNVILQIEELNRGNPAAIFGDVLQLLDRDDDGRSRYGVIPTRELHAHIVNQGITLPDGLLRLPPNLYLWATMNSADQGVFPIDTAFRRRWSYIYMGYSEPCLYATEHRKIKYAGNFYDWDAFRGALNKHLVQLNVHEDKLIGPYFLTLKQLAEPESVLEKLFLYLWDDVLRFRQEALFDSASFSEVAKTWTDGEGAPLKFGLPDALQPPVPAAPDLASAATQSGVVDSSSPTAPSGSQPAAA